MSNLENDIESSENYYEKQLYPLQDKVLRLLDSKEINFYLTGGTALNRCYLHHRFSDDLDFFLNHSLNFMQEVSWCIDILKKYYGNNLQIANRFDSFIRLFINENNIDLKIEFINDVKFRVGDVVETPLYSRMDNIDNILSNKICALSRNVAKDLADIWFIAQKYSFNWKEVIANAQEKDLWVDEGEVLKILGNSNLQTLEEVKWKINLDISKAKSDFDIILNDILFGRDNSLCNIK